MTTSTSPKTLIPVTPVTTSTAIYATGSANSQTIIRNCVFANNTNAAVTINVWLVPSAGSSGAGNLLIEAQSIAAFSRYLAPELINAVLGGGDTIQCNASAGSSVNIYAAGFVTS